MAGPERFERPTPSFVAKCSIQLSYGPVLLSITTCVGSGKWRWMLDSTLNSDLFGFQRLASSVWLVRS